ncbi:MAG: hypothetical protein QXL50_02675, partial [Candidatus Pacearchaeota archaeon]
LKEKNVFVFNVEITRIEDQIINVLLTYPQYFSAIEKYPLEIFSGEIKELIEIIKDFKDKEKLNVGLILEEIKNEELKKKCALLSFSSKVLINNMKEEDFKRLLDRYLYEYYYNKQLSGEMDDKILAKIYEIKKNLIKGGK